MKIYKKNLQNIHDILLKVKHCMLAVFLANDIFTFIYLYCLFLYPIFIGGYLALPITFQIQTIILSSFFDFFIQHLVLENNFSNTMYCVVNG
jgi:hypothetical protein